MRTLCEGPKFRLNFQQLFLGSLQGELFVLFSQEGARIIYVVVVRLRTLTHTRLLESLMHSCVVTVLTHWFMRWNGEFDDLTRPDMSSYFIIPTSATLRLTDYSIAERLCKYKNKIMTWYIRIQRYTLRRSAAPVMRLQMGHNFVEPRHLNQHSLQHVCQQPIDTVGSVYGSIQIRQRRGVKEVTGADS